MRTNSEARLTVLGLAWLALVAGGCSQISNLSVMQSDQRILKEIAGRIQAMGNIEGKGTVRLESRDQTIDIPFSVRFTRDAVLEIDAEISTALLPGLGKVTVVSDATKTLVYAGAGVINPVETREEQTALRALLLSAFGGGDMLAFWAAGNRCDLASKIHCSGLDIELKLNRESRSVERWAIKEQSGRVSFSGLVYALNGGGPLPRIITGIVHPQEIAVTVKYDEIGLASAGSAIGRELCAAAKVRLSAGVKVENVPR